MLSEQEKERIKKELREFKPPYRKDVITQDGNEITIDWKELAEMERYLREGTHSATLFYGTLSHLIDLGVFSLEAAGNYQLSGCSVFLNPRSYGILPLFFTRKKDAEAYKEAMFGGARYPVDIYKS